LTQAARNRIDPEQALHQAIATGALVDLRTGQTEADDPARGGTWEQPRIGRAELLAELLTQHAEGQRRPRALRLADARITGALDLEGASSSARCCCAAAGSTSRSPSTRPTLSRCGYPAVGFPPFERTNC
jgi:hypothetical protein